MGSLNSGMPYISTPPAACRASNMVTLCPSLARSAAQVSPAGPEPITATFLPVGGASWVGDLFSLWPRSQSATYLSMRPMAMGAFFLPSVQTCSHCVSCGQTLPQMAGRAFLLLSILTASGISPSRTALMNSGISTFTGQPLTHMRLGHWMQREASSLTISSV